VHNIWFLKIHSNYYTFLRLVLYNPRQWTELCRENNNNNYIIINHYKTQYHERKTVVKDASKCFKVVFEKMS